MSIPYNIIKINFGPYQNKNNIIHLRIWRKLQAEGKIIGKILLFLLVYLPMAEKHSCINLNFSEIKILTYNLFLRPPYVKTNENDYKNHRMKLFLSVCHNYDIVCLQEVFSLGSHRKATIIKKCMRAGFCFYATSPDPSFFSPYLIDGGLLILSR